VSADEDPVTPDPSELPSPVVSPGVYTEEYYRQWCAGYEEWTASGGAAVAGIYPGILRLAGFQQGNVLVDIGTGRGEMLAVAVEAGASRAIGIEYAPAAVQMAEQTLDVHGVRERAEVMLADARSVPVPDATADLVTMVDVVEHLADAELTRSLEEAGRMLKPGGRVFIHTMPNRLIYDVTYRLQRLLKPGRRRAWPKDPRLHHYEHVMHVNEQTEATLRRYLQRTGFAPVRVWLGEWIYTDFVPDRSARRLYHRLARLPFTKRFGAADLFAEGTKPGG
jgi:ubiquinone/menaquinone biosynthesis C-methylase UbiE